jgi:phosphate transport system protein
MSAPRYQRRLHEELDLLQERLMEMAGLSEDMVHRAVDAFLERNGEALKSIKEDDRRIDSLEVELDEGVVALIALHQPVASDLRHVLTTLKIANDIERVGDHAHNIAKAARRSAKTRPLPEIPELAELAVLAQRMLGDALASLGSRDPARARGVCARDDRVDDMKAAVQKILVRVMSEDPESIRTALEYIRVAQQLERIGDLSTNISEEVVFLVEGHSIKHPLGAGGAAGGG